ncbi:restriction endonuclease subunit S, partial [Candidatus Bathyarchaeota archaeon]
MKFYKETNFKETPIGKTPKTWKIVKVEEVALPHKGAIKIGPFGSQIKKSEMVPKGVKVYGQENVIKNNFVIGSRYISYKKYKALKSVEIFPGDILITMMGSVGYATIFPENAEKGIMDSHLLRIQVDRQLILPIFLIQLIGCDLVKHQIKMLSRGAIMSGLNSRIVRSIRIPLPQLPEQQK